MLHTLIGWLSGNTQKNNTPEFKRLAVYKIEKTYLEYKSNQRIQKNIELNIENYKNVICKKPFYKKPY
jgi:hypothetical protein